MYQKFLTAIDKKAQRICAVSDGIWDYAEGSFGEYESMEILTGALDHR